MGEGWVGMRTCKYRLPPQPSPTSGRELGVMHMPPLASFDQVIKDYPHKGAPLRAVDGVSFQIQPGEVFGLIGPNRAGKTTLIKLLLSLCQPTQGKVERLGSAATDCRTLAEVGYVHESPAFPKYLTATALLEFYGALSMLEEKEVKLRVPRLLHDVGLADRARESIGRFSKGMLQRLGLAQALLAEPRLLVLDEPSEGLDLGGRQLLRRLITEQRARGGSVLYVTHLLGEVEQVCDRVGVLVAGQMQYVGPVKDLTHNGPLEEAVKRYYPSPSMN